MQNQTINCITQTINKLSSTDEYKLVQLNGEWIKGPMKWIIMVLGPNHQAKDLSSLMKQEYKNLNIIIIKITNDQKDQFGGQMRSGNKMFHHHSKLRRMKSPVSDIASDFKQMADLDIVTKNLNKLVRQTNEGYMEIIDQKEFEKQKDPNTTVHQGSTIDSPHLSKEVEKTFQRICESIELYKTDNIQIITELLEF